MTGPWTCDTCGGLNLPATDCLWCLARAARYGEPTDIYTWDMVVRAILGPVMMSLQSTAGSTANCENRQTED